ncbi:MAG: polysaccharide deacetylase family protein [Aquimonas sp.]|nr:polysaccharide deacetylase family protein [Aquimonas sp.]
MQADVVNAVDSAPRLILMYHGLSEAGAQPRGADPHYTLPVQAFAAQLDALLAAGCTLGAARDLLDAAPEPAAPCVMLGFDDGDASNHGLAWPRLAARGLAADFFVNPARVGRPGFCDWGELREMAEAGMSIQSHGLTHTYFTHLDATALREELRVSKLQIEAQLGQAVTLLAPPGGRSPRDLVALARSLGYRAVLGSEPGLLGGHDPGQPLPRLALTADHGVDSVLGWVEGGEAAVAPLKRRYRRLALAKRMLGDRGYEHVRALALGLLRARGGGKP